MLRPASLLPLLLCVAACSRPHWEEIDATRWTPEQESQVEEARQAAMAVGVSLLTAVREAIAEQGLVEAVAFCNLQAVSMTAAAQLDNGPKVGRTSFRLRSRDNHPPAWAALAVKAAEDRVHLFAGPEGQHGVLLPIPTGPLCLNCHGNRETFAPELVEELLELYPHDEATGFALDQLRGYFWVELGGDA